MRYPTPKELHVMRTCLEGLREDLDALERKDDQTSIYSVLGTMGVNLDVLHANLHRMCEDEAPERVALLKQQLRRLQTGDEIEGDELTDMELKLLARAEKAEQERDEAQALANTLHRRLDVWVERAEQAERSCEEWRKRAEKAEERVCLVHGHNVKLKSRIDAALEAAGNRWAEWGERALSVAAILSGEEEL